MTGFGVDVAAMYAASHQLTVVVDDLGTDQAVLQRQIEGLISVGWSGASARSFASGWAEWSRGFRDAESALRQMAELLAATGRTYEQAETGAHEVVAGSGPWSAAT